MKVEIQMVSGALWEFEGFLQCEDIRQDIAYQCKDKGNQFLTIDTHKEYLLIPISKIEYIRFIDEE